MASYRNEQNLEDLDLATVHLSTSGQAAEYMPTTLSSSSPRKGPTNDRYNADIGNETDAYPVNTIHGSRPNCADHEQYHNEQDQNLEQLKKENRELKAMIKCYCCKINDFSFVLSCSHTVCKACADRIFCICKERIVQRHPFILPPR